MDIDRDAPLGPTGSHGPVGVLDKAQDQKAQRIRATRMVDGQDIRKTIDVLWAYDALETTESVFRNSILKTVMGQNPQYYRPH